MAYEVISLKTPKNMDFLQLVKKPIKGGFVIHGLDERMKRCCRFVPNNYPIPKKDKIEKYKLFMSRN